MTITITRELPVTKIGTGWSLPGIARIVNVDAKRVNAVLTLRDTKSTFEMTVRLDTVLTVEREVQTTGERLLEAYADFRGEMLTSIRRAADLMDDARERLNSSVAKGPHSVNWDVMTELHRAIEQFKVMRTIQSLTKDITTDREYAKTVMAFVNEKVLEFTPEQSTSKVSNLMGEIEHVQWQSVRRSWAFENVTRCQSALVEKGPDANATGW